MARRVSASPRTALEAALTARSGAPLAAIALAALHPLAAHLARRVSPT